MIHCTLKGGFGKGRKLTPCPHERESSMFEVRRSMFKKKGRSYILCCLHLYFYLLPFYFFLYLSFIFWSFGYWNLEFIWNLVLGIWNFISGGRV